MKKLLQILNNKYAITIIVFGIWMMFFDNHNFITQIRLSRSLHDLEREKEYYLREIEKDRQATLELMTDTLTLEKFGREQYQMKRDNEDIYLVVDDEE